MGRVKLMHAFSAKVSGAESTLARMNGWVSQLEARPKHSLHVADKGVAFSVLVRPV